MDYKFKLKFLPFNEEFETLHESLGGFSEEDSANAHANFQHFIEDLFDHYFTNPELEDQAIPVLDLITEFHKRFKPGTKQWEFFIIVLLSEKIQIEISKLLTSEIDEDDLLNFPLGEGGNS